METFFCESSVSYSTAWNRYYSNIFLFFISKLTSRSHLPLIKSKQCHPQKHCLFVQNVSHKIYLYSISISFIIFYIFFSGFNVICQKGLKRSQKYSDRSFRFFQRSVSSGLPLRLHRDLASASAPGLPYLHLSGGRGKGGLLVSQYSLLGAHDPAWLTLLLLSSGAAIHHDTGDGGGQKYSQRAQYTVIRHNGK